MAEEKKSGKILATIICLTTDDTVKNDNDRNFKRFWENVEKCKIYENHQNYLTEEGFKKALEKVKEKFIRKKYDSLILAVSAHGIEKEWVTESDGSASLNLKWYYKGQEILCELHEMLKIFDDQKLKNKQKIFLLQVCRVRSSIETVTREGHDSLHLSKTTPEFQHAPTEPENIHPSQSAPYLNDATIPWPKTWKITQPCIRNSIVLFSASSGFKSYTTKYSQKEGGGWIFVCMADLLNDIKGSTISIFDLFLMVNEKMSSKETFDGKNVGLSSFNHMLTEELFIKIKD